MQIKGCKTRTAGKVKEGEQQQMAAEHPENFHFQLEEIFQSASVSVTQYLRAASPCARLLKKWVYMYTVAKREQYTVASYSKIVIQQLEAARSFFASRRFAGAE